MKKLICMILGVCVLLCSCQASNSQPSEEEQPQETLQTIEQLQMQKGMNIRAGLYFHDSASSKLVSETREFVVTQEQNVGEELMEQLLAGPTNQSLNGISYGTELVDIEVMDEVANVYLKATQDMDAYEQYVLRAAVTDTLVDYYDLAYVNVFIDGATNYETHPKGAFKKSSGTLDSDFAKYQNNYLQNTSNTTEGSGALQSNAVLYFADSTLGFLLPEIRQISFEDGNRIVDTLISELILGPSYGNNMQGLISQDIVNEYAYELVENETGHIQCNLRLQYPANVLPNSNQELDKLCYASLFYTLRSVIPSLDTLHITLEYLEQDNQITLTREDVKQYLGRTIDLYFPGKDFTMLYPTKRVVYNKEAGLLRSRLDQLIRGPIASDSEEIWPIFSQGITSKDILSVEIYDNSIAVVDLSQNFSDVMSSQPAETEFVTIYTMVNTLTGYTGIKKVKFMVEGKEILGFTGELYLKNPLMKNPGIIKE